MNIRNELYKKAFADFNYVYSSQKEVIVLDITNNSMLDVLMKRGYKSIVCKQIKLSTYLNAVLYLISRILKITIDEKHIMQCEDNKAQMTKCWIKK